MEDNGRAMVLNGAITYFRHIGHRLAFRILLDIDLALAAHLGCHPVGKRVDTGNTYAMKSAGNFVSALVEFSSCMKDSHYDFKSRPSDLALDSYRNASSVILDAYGVVFENGDFDGVAVSSHGLVDTIVDDLIDKMMQAPLPYVSNVHGRSLADRLKPLQDLDTIFGVLFLRLDDVFVIHEKINLFYNLIKFTKLPKNPQTANSPSPKKPRGRGAEIGWRYFASRPK